MRSSLTRYVARAATDEPELRAMRAAAWHQQGIVVLKPEDIRDAFARQAVINEAERLWGKRGRDHHGK